MVGTYGFKVSFVMIALIAAGDVFAAAVVRGPYLQIGTPTSMVIRWRTDVPTDSRVLYGTTMGTLDREVVDAAMTQEHEILISGLTSDTQYFYSVGTSAATLAGNSATYRFKTNPTATRPIRIWAIGDAGTGKAVQKPVRDAFMNYTGARGADLMIQMGDNAYVDGTDAQYQSYQFDVYDPVFRNTVNLPAIGNHDAHIAAGAVFYKNFSMPTNGQAGGVPSGTEAYYSFDYGNIHFVCLDSENSSNLPSGPMATWLKSDLMSTKKDWVIAYWHHSPYSKASHDSDSESQLVNMRKNIVPILESYGVDLVLTGHSHSYERSYLLDGHYGLSSTLTKAMVLNGGLGGASAPYTKASQGLAPHQGAVYALVGSSGQIQDQGALNHPANAVSLMRPGSLVIDVVGNRLEAKFLRDTGAIDDTFVIVKGTGPMPAPSPTPVVTPTPMASPTPVVTPTPTPSPTPVVTPKPSPTPVVTPKPSPTPVVTPKPSPTPVVTPKPSPTPAVTPPPAGPTGEFANSSKTYRNKAIPSQSGAFSAEFDLVPLADNIDALTMLAGKSVSAYDDSAIGVRLSTAGVIDVRNGAAYAANAVVRYAANRKYHVAIVGDVTTHRYSVTITSDDGTQTRIAENFAFRTTQSTVTKINTLSVRAGTGSHQVHGFTVSSSATVPAMQPPVPGPVVVPNPAPVVVVPPSPPSVPSTAAMTSIGATSQNISGTLFGVDSAQKNYSIQKSQNGSIYRFEVMQGDGRVNGRDAGKDRSELSGSDQKYATGTDIWVAYAFKVEPGTALPGKANVLGQFHAGVGSPNFAFRLPTDNELQVELRVGDAGNYTQVIPYKKSDFVRGKWYQVVIHAKFSGSPNAVLQVWLDGVPVVNRSGFVMGYNQSTSNYWKFGIYRSTSFPGTEAVQYANMEVGTSDLSSRVTAPKAIVP